MSIAQVSLVGEAVEVKKERTTFNCVPQGRKFQVVKPDGNCGCVLVKVSCGSATAEINGTKHAYPFKGTEEVLLIPLL